MNRTAVIFIIITVLYILRDRLPLPLFQLPGDFEIKTNRVHFVLPITTCLLISLVLSIVFSIVGKR